MTAVLQPRSIDHAIEALTADPDALVMAGGTDLMVAINAGLTPVRSVVVVRDLPELQVVETDTSAGVLRLGASVTYTRLLEPDVAAVAPALAQAARTVGSPQIRNAGTVGGNLATASPAGDLLPVLLALRATVELAGPDGTRRVPLDQFCTGPKQTALGPGELIVAASLPVVAGRQEYRKVGVRNAMVIAVASVALSIDVEHRTVRTGLGSVGPVPLGAPGAEAYAEAALDWIDRGVAPVQPAVASRFSQLTAEAARPIDDHRSTAAYRRHAVGVLAGRCLQACTRVAS